MHIEELLDPLGRALRAKPRQSAGAVMAATPGRSGWPASACRFACPGFAREREIPLRSYEALLAIAPSMTCCRRVLYLVPQLRGGRRGDSRGDRPVGVDGVPCVIQAARRNSANSRSGTSPGSCGPGAGRQDVRRVDDGRRAGHHDDGGQTVPGLRRDGHREREGVDPVPRSLVERGLDVSQLLVIVDGGLQGAPDFPPPRPSATVVAAENVVSYVAKREQPVWRQRLQRDTVRSTTRPSPPSSRSSELEDRNQSAAGSPRPRRDPDVAASGCTGRSLKTEASSPSTRFEERCAKVVWQNSSQRHAGWPLRSWTSATPAQGDTGRTCPGFVTH